MKRCPNGSHCPSPSYCDSEGSNCVIVGHRTMTDAERALLNESLKPTHTETQIRWVAAANKPRSVPMKTRKTTIEAGRIALKREPPTLVDEIRRAINKLRAGTEDALSGFRKALDGDDPCHAFEWATDAMSAAAERKVAKQVEGDLDGMIRSFDDDPANHPGNARTALNRLHARLQELLLREARSPTSGSFMHTAMAVRQNTARAKLVEDLDFLVKCPIGTFAGEKA